MDGATPPPTGIDDGDAEYLKAIASCGDRRPLVAAHPIYSANGIKLLDSGAKIDSRILERLFGHTLTHPIDQCVMAEDGVRSKNLVARGRELVAAAPLLAHFEATLKGQSERLWSTLADCRIPPAISLRLTVARDTAPILYEHSLRAAFLALFIGIRARLSERDLQLLAMAALLHDLGMMYTDRARYDAEKTIDMAARRQLFAHPLTAQLIAQREPLLSPLIAVGIAQHHERLDGTGYPKGLEGDQIGRIARVLMLVEVILAAVEHDREQSELRLSLILRLNHRSFDPALSALVLASLPRVTLSDAPMSDQLPEFRDAVRMLDAWNTLKVDEPGAEGAAAAFIDARIDRLRRWLADAGLGDPQAAAAAAEQEPALRAEIAALGREALWHVRQIAYDALTRWPELQQQPTADAAGPASRWIASGLRSERPERAPAA